MIFVLETVLRSSLVLGLGLGAMWILRKQPAALRHWVLAGAILLAAAQPAINLLMPSWQLPVLQTSERETGSTVSDRTEFVLDAAPAPPRGDRQPLDLTRALGWVWAIGVALGVGILAFGAAWLSWLGARSSPANGDWLDAAEAVRAELRIVPPVRIAVTKHPTLLVTWGAWTPIILLPAASAAWSAERVQLVLAHEMAHMVRRDWLIQVTAEVVRAVYWFNPLFWIACDRLRRESELACDDIVLDLGIRRTAYASHLVDLARAFRLHRTWLPAPSIARPSTLERRVRAMLNPHLDRRPMSRVRRAALAAILLAIALPIAAASQSPSTPSGTVADPHGKPLPDATVRLTALNGGQVFETRTNDAGSFQFPDVPAGDYMLSVHSPGFSGQRQRMQLKGGGTTITLQVQVGTLRERVTVGAGTGEKNSAGAVSTSPYTPGACAPSATGGHIIPPMKVRDVRPFYKQELIDSRIEGEVLLQARIGIDGTVRSVEIISPVNADLEDAAAAAVSQWRFTPTYLNCEPVEVRMYVTVAFKAER